MVLHGADGVSDLPSGIGHPAYAPRDDGLANRALGGTGRMESTPHAARNEETGQKTHLKTLAHGRVRWCTHEVRVALSGGLTRSALLARPHRRYRSVLVRGILIRVAAHYGT